MTPDAAPTALESRVPPHDLEAERSVLGSVMLQPDALGRIIGKLRDSDFYRENHAEIFRAMTELYSRGEPIDLVTVAAALSRIGTLERVGGRPEIAALMEAVPTAANIEFYSEIVREKAQRRRLIQAGGELVAKGFDETRPTPEAVSQAQSVVLDLTSDTLTSEPELIGELLHSFMDRLDTIKSGEINGLSTGYTDVDRYWKGAKPGDLILIAARASMGKTVYALNIARNVAVDQKVPTAIFSLEMSKEQLIFRLAAMQGRVDKDRLEANLLSEQEYQRVMDAMGPLADAPLYIDEQTFIDELTLAAKARALMVKVPLGLIVVDYLQLVRSSRDFRGNNVQATSWVSASLKGLARELKVPVVALSQLSRAPDSRENKRPVLSDLRESGALEQDADIVTFLYRDEYYAHEKSDQKGIAEVIVAKHRNGPTGTVKLRFRREHQRFDSLDQYHNHPTEDGRSANSPASAMPWDEEE